jgi:fucose 4-O-acetylase-like acetyltransferase
MSPLPYPPSRPLAVGEILDLSFRMYRQTLVKCLLLSGVAVVISQLPILYLLLGGRGLKQPFLTSIREPAYVGVYLLSIALVVTVYAAILRRQYNILTGAQVGNELAAAARRAPAVGLLAALCSLAFVAGASWALLFPDLDRRLGVLLLVLLPAGYAFVTFSSALAALMVSEAAPVASLTRSWRLTRGSFWRLTLVYAVAFVVLLVLYMLLGTATLLLIALAAHADLALVTATGAVVMVALGAFAVPFYMAVQLAVFGDLTARREGTDLAQRIAATA